MIKFELLRDAGVLIVAPKEALTAEDSRTISSAIDPYIGSNGKLTGLLLEAPSFPGNRAKLKTLTRKAATAWTRTAAGSAMGRPAPVQTAITNVLKKRRTGLTMDRLQAALPKFDEKSLLNATFAMRRKGLITFEKNGKGRGKYRWQD